MPDKTSQKPIGYIISERGQGQVRPMSVGSNSTVLKSAYHTKSYTGHEALADVDLVHMNGRVYDPILGRFMSADPFVQYIYNSQSFNRYSYVLNNPLGATDPSGYMSESFSYWSPDAERTWSGHTYGGGGTGSQLGGGASDIGNESGLNPATGADYLDPSEVRLPEFEALVPDVDRPGWKRRILDYKPEEKQLDNFRKAMAALYNSGPLGRALYE